MPASPGRATKQEVGVSVPGAPSGQRGRAEPERPPGSAPAGSRHGARLYWRGDPRGRYSVGGGKFAAEAGPKQLHANGAPLLISHKMGFVAREPLLGAVI